MKDDIRKALGKSRLIEVGITSKPDGFLGEDAEEESKEGKGADLLEHIQDEIDEAREICEDIEDAKKELVFEKAKRELSDKLSYVISKTNELDFEALKNSDEDESAEEVSQIDRLCDLISKEFEEIDEKEEAEDAINTVEELLAKIKSGKL